MLTALRREADEHGKTLHSVVRSALAEHVFRGRQVHYWRERVAHRLGIPIEEAAS